MGWIMSLVMYLLGARFAMAAHSALYPESSVAERLLVAALWPVFTVAVLLGSR